MRRLLLLPFLLLFTCPAWATAPSIVHHGQTNNSAASSLSLTITAVAAGHDIWVFVGAPDTTRQTINTPTLSGETFVKDTGCSAAYGGGIGHGQIACYHLSGGKANGGGGTTLAVSMSPGSDLMVLEYVEISGQKQSGTPDASGHSETNLGGTGGTTSVSTSAATTNATDLCLTEHFSGNYGGGTLTVSSPFTALDASDGGAGNMQGVDASYTTTSTGTVTATVSWPSNGYNYTDASIVCAAPPSAGGVVRHRAWVIQ